MRAFSGTRCALRLRTRTLAASLRAFDPPRSGRYWPLPADRLAASSPTEVVVGIAIHPSTRRSEAPSDAPVAAKSKVGAHDPIAEVELVPIHQITVTMHPRPVCKIICQSTLPLLPLARTNERQG